MLGRASLAESAANGYFVVPHGEAGSVADEEADACAAFRPEHAGMPVERGGTAQRLPWAVAVRLAIAGPFGPWCLAPSAGVPRPDMGNARSASRLSVRAG